MRLFFLIILGILILSGCKKDPPDPPGEAVLTEPARDSECTPVQGSSGNSSLVRFSWQTASDTDSYKLQVRNLVTGNTISRSLKGTIEIISVEKSTPFSWFVVSNNLQTSETTTSAIWSFYNPGTRIDHVPFPAEIISPKSGAIVFKDINNQITLEWSGADIDDDIESYQIYFSDENPPKVIIALLGAYETSQKVSVTSGVVYYWRVVTIDAEGNTSDTGILDFKVF